VLKIRKDSLTV